MNLDPETLGFIAVCAFIAAIAFAWAYVRANQTHRAVEEHPPVSTARCATHGCHAAPVVRYQGRLHCQRCADELAAIDQWVIDKARGKETP